MRPLLRSHKAGIVLSFVLLAGCSSTGTLIRNPAVLVKDPGRLVGNPRFEKNVAKIVAIWEPSNGKNPEDQNCRGFAGQILFFGPTCETGARVKGRINIYEYDYYNPDSDENPEPLHVFTFEPDAWDAHRIEGTLGHSYSVFIPYMNKHKDQVNCALKVELILEDGRKISTPETEVMLPGRNTAGMAAQRTRGFVTEKRIGPAADAQPVVLNQQASKPPERKLEALSIPLPRR